MVTYPSSYVQYAVATALAVSILSIVVWNRKRKEYVRVGKISKLLFYPVKCLKPVEVTKGTCTKLGLEVGGLLDRSFMIVDNSGAIVYQKHIPSLVLLTPEVKGNFIIINAPNKEALRVEIKKSPSPDDKWIECQLFEDTIRGLDCGDEAACWLQSYSNMDGIRLVQFIPSGTVRKYTRKNPFFAKLRKEYQAGFQNLVPFHVVSKATIDTINSKQEKKEITVHNFRPNILAEDCQPFAEDSWRHVKFNSGAELLTLMLTTRCLSTTNDPETGILDQKEPLVSLRKYRIPADKKILEITGSRVCVGTNCAVVSTGELQVGDDIYAVVEERPKMKVKDP